jgi:hypothetical protein
LLYEKDIIDVGGSSIKTGRSSESHPNLFEDGRVVTDEDKVKACEDLKSRLS